MSITPIACHVSGTAWQNAWTRACSSAANSGSAENTTPDVPSTTDSGSPACVTPTPRAPAAWSPAPAATGIPSDVSPDTSADSSARGSHSAGTPSAEHTSSLHVRRATSNSSVPEASATSIARSPHSFSRT